MTALPPLAQARWTQVDAGHRRLLIVPTGSLEQHGPHLPMETDARIATAVATAVHAALPEVGLAPTISIGASGEHAGFPGTLSIGTEALTQVLIELVRHAAGDWQHVLFINGHGGNAAALRECHRVCTYEGHSVHVHHLGVPGGDAHAGRTETSLMLHLCPQDVLMSAAEAGNVAAIEELLPELRSGGVRAVSPNGVLGDPTGATAAEGQRLFDALVDRATEVAVAIASGQDPTDGGPHR